jgi:hypothetical protein
MDRRSFFTSGIAAGTLPFAASIGMAQEDSKPVYEMLIFKMKTGDQGKRMEEWAANYLMPMSKELNIGPIGVFKAAIADYTPHMMFIIEHPGMGQIQKIWQKAMVDPRWREGVKQMEKDDVPAYESYEARLLQATSYSPPLSNAVGKSDKPRLFEFRVYHAPTFRQLGALSKRFKGPEIKLFHKSGIHPILYAHTMYGPDMPNLAYLMPFDSLSAREKAWAKFRQDPEWSKVLSASQKADGEIVAYLSRNIYNATDYSEIK